MYRKAFGVAFLCAVCVGVPLIAHHSHGNYDLTTWTVMEGSVKQMVFIVPHSIVYIDVAKGDHVGARSHQPQGIFLGASRKKTSRSATRSKSGAICSATAARAACSAS